MLANEVDTELLTDEVQRDLEAAATDSTTYETTLETATASTTLIPSDENSSTRYSTVSFNTAVDDKQDRYMWDFRRRAGYCASIIERTNFQ